MDASHIDFGDLKAGRDVQRVVGRLLRFWEARNVKKAGELMGVDLLLVDEKSTIMHGSIHVLHLPKFQPSLVEGAVYVISGFEVTRSNTRFKITDFDKSIRINQGTSMDVIDESLCVIPKELFRFRSHGQLVTLSNTNKELPDVIGQVCSSKAYRNEATQKMERMLVHLRLERCLGWQHNKANADRCWRNIKKSFHGVRVPRLPIYMETIRAMRPTIMCNINELENTSAHYYY